MNRNKYLAEMLGTFALVFMGTGAVIVDQLTKGRITTLGVGLVFGFVVMTMINAVGPISGAHMNPAVTWGFYLMGRHPREEILPYMGSQILGGIMASAILRFLFSGYTTTLGVTLPSGSVFQSLLLESVLSFFLMFVILRVATGDREEGMMAGLAIGATVALEAIFGGPISGASMNPARSFAPALISGVFIHHWIYWMAPFTGCTLAVLFIKKTLIPR